MHESSVRKGILPYLALDPAYREYMLEVRYRLVPFVF